MAKETIVIVEKSKAAQYAGGNGYRGKFLRLLEFPEGPYMPNVARALLNQLASYKRAPEFVGVKYLEPKGVNDQN